MNKTSLAGAMALCMSLVSNASAITIEVTQMDFGGATRVTDDDFIHTDNIGTTVFGYLEEGTTQLDSFYWEATTQAAFTAAGAHTWAGTSPQGDYSYSFSLTSSQVAFGLFFDWWINYDIPVLAIFDCDGFEHGDVCIGVPNIPMQTSPFPGYDSPTFNGTVSAIPLPPAIWLFSTGLISIIGAFHIKSSSSGRQKHAT
ncbi:MAG: hypothetical protein OEY89_06465 [Gammaproteobacteria bacterium]|nr:hypothetical protein [Gammaproteobacteria bacterium]